MNKVIHVMFAPFKCTACENAKKRLPKFCKKHGWEYIIIDEIDDYDNEYFPTIFATVGKKLVFTMEGFNLKELKDNINKYN